MIVSLTKKLFFFSNLLTLSRLGSDPTSTPWGGGREFPPLQFKARLTPTSLNMIPLKTSSVIVV